jgi:glycosyltransferase involved in cell wall biosynthesis
VSAPLVSIVTPSYNQAAFLEETIVSVLEQDYPAVEYAVVDGGSTDGSVQIIERYADRLAWWRSEPDGGQADALNTAFARANGTYLGWINSDDTLLPGAVSRVVEVLEANPRAVLGYGGIVHTDDASRQGEYFPPVVLPVAEMLRTWTFMVAQQGSLFRRDAWERVGPLNVERYYTFDSEFFLELALVGELAPVDAPLATYRFHEESYSITDPVRRADDHVSFVSELFASDVLPPELRALEADAKAYAFLWAARLYYTGGEHALARRYYLRALRLSPALATSRVGLLLRSLLPSGVRRLARAA